MAKSIAFTDLMRAFVRTSPGASVAVAVNIAMFVIVRTGLLFDPGFLRLVELGGSFGSLLSRPWTLLTFAFVQVDFLHLLVNMLLMLFFARRLGRLSAQRVFWTLYFAGAIAGGMVFVVLTADSGAHLVGSSASVMAVVIAATINNPKHELTLFPGIRLRMWVLTAILIAIDLLTISAPDTTAHAAHLAGAAAGALVALVVIRCQRPMRPIPAARNGNPDDVNLILSKLRDSGHDSLTPDEKRRLFNLSQRNNR